MLMIAMMLAAAQDGAVTARQTVVPVEQVLSGKDTMDKGQRDELRETRRHNRKMEREFEKLRDGKSVFSIAGPKGRFTLPSGKVKARRTVSLPPNSTRY